MTSKMLLLDETGPEQEQNTESRRDACDTGQGATHCLGRCFYVFNVFIGLLNHWVVIVVLKVNG